jgi:hypothetical protein
LETAAPWENGGKGIRTPDFQLAKLALYQLSYAPKKSKIEDGRWKMRDCNLGSTRVPRVGEAVSDSQTFSKIVSARRRNQHARRVRYPEQSP